MQMPHAIPGPGGTDAARSSIMIDVFLPAALFLWWGFAVSRYLKMDHAWGVALAVLIMAALAAHGVRVAMRLEFYLL